MWVYDLCYVIRYMSLWLTLCYVTEYVSLWLTLCYMTEYVSLRLVLCYQVCEFMTNIALCDWVWEFTTCVMWLSMRVYDLCYVIRYVSLRLTLCSFCKFVYVILYNHVLTVDFITVTTILLLCTALVTVRSKIWYAIYVKFPVMFMFILPVDGFLEMNETRDQIQVISHI
jgi:hypothetical protein